MARVSPASWGRVWSLVSTIGLLFVYLRGPTFLGHQAEGLEHQES